MITRISNAKKMFLLAGGLLMALGPAWAQSWDRRELRRPSDGSDFRRASFSLQGGFSFTEHREGMLDLQSELQFGVFRNVRVGIGAGYLNRLGRGGQDSEKGKYQDARSPLDQMFALITGTDGTKRTGDQGGESRSHFRAFPLALNLYYILPVGRAWSVFLSGGGAFYFGSFEEPGLSTQNKNAFGGQAGAGLELRLANRVRLVAEGGYRFVRFNRLRRLASGVSPYLGLTKITDITFPGGNRNESGRSPVTIFADWLKALTGPQSIPTETYSLDLNGFSCRAGLKLSF